MDLSENRVPPNSKGLCEFSIIFLRSIAFFGGCPLIAQPIPGDLRSERSERANRHSRCSWDGLLEMLKLPEKLSNSRRCRATDSMTSHFHGWKRGLGGFLKWGIPKSLFFF